MVRAHMKQTPEEKKETHKKKSTSKKKTETGSWPCKIDGCNKVFAREADLKRHQRTTKTHSQPGFACPQCDATFTRTDALRRHQKSRHNGVVIEPSEQDKIKTTDDDPDSSGSKSPSPAGTPTRSVSDGNAKSTPSALAQPTTSGPASGPSSYYRQHTMNGYTHPPRPLPGMLIDPHYPPPPIGLPTSATRLHQANWHPPPPPWGAEALYMPPYYPPSPYYRHPGAMMAPMPHPQSQMPPQASSEQSKAGQNGSSVPPMNGLTPPQSTRSTPPRSEGTAPTTTDEHADAEMEDESSQATDASVIDPSLESTQTSLSQSGASQAQAPAAADEGDADMKIAAAAVQAVLAYSKNVANRAEVSGETFAQPEEQTTDAVGSPGVQPEAVTSYAIAQQDVQPQDSSTVQQLNTTVELPANAAIASPQPAAGAVTEVEKQQGQIDGVGEQKTEVEGTLELPMPAELSLHRENEQMLTEDGEPMLNPAELLTQESLASPPPS